MSICSTERGVNASVQKTPSSKELKKGAEERGVALNWQSLSMKVLEISRDKPS